MTEVVLWTLAYLLGGPVIFAICFNRDWTEGGVMWVFLGPAYYVGLTSMLIGRMVWG